MRKLVVSLLAALALVAGLVAPAATVGAAHAAPAAQKAQAETSPKAQRSTQAQKKTKKKKAKKNRRKPVNQMRTWNRLAQCESGGRWKINTGNGYYGGLQISPSTWSGFGGKKYAGLPHRATKKEQVKVAKRIKHGQGWGAWPSCSRQVGLR